MAYFSNVPTLSAEHAGSSVRWELLSATDEEIERSLAYTDPMVLRGLVYQLTGDEELLQTQVAKTRFFLLKRMDRQVCRMLKRSRPRHWPF